MTCMIRETFIIFIRGGGGGLVSPSLVNYRTQREIVNAPQLRAPFRFTVSISTKSVPFFNVMVNTEFIPDRFAVMSKENGGFRGGCIFAISDPFRGTDKE